jgi:hypothetical protein
MKDNISEVTAAAIIRRCTIDDFRGFQTKTQGYCRSFTARYYDEYMDDKGEKVYRNMQITVRGFNEIARYMKAEFKDSDTVYVAGALETYDDNYGVHTCIRVMQMKDMVKLTTLGAL